ncbi:protein-L-isoaspartate O-methyltransferase family protein [Phaeobacter gallaeciensis]|jgi:protein-L-isoaspartate(D-aspartate) O-methyltransferase|uniref:protein-L-isoaspartate O-methyltransferase family protein n=1 Tax=Phaeobacter gallaeciensis TaxID=60890 RepID=UPI00237F3D27|nr:protein-L-isoaspartate O-methyltransferase [Phaeobacter gallaeciensis]MDE4191012.1 protein-L-isoaspartate O-methyltransferase [Phaeobacter gallaeciensis]MDE4199478.1 protein-L-isoaspartate O-methyltransferase [Phaeobacter gallaeciensis]MDE4203626.1 protein-L-isoaspartate O-methyltransferase [Phaeobacter gallaeciensis]MDE4207768.1 protein-L-isoaspartate O-methyltransferase [Phaeobacter gallaeciensis]MDE4216135.1 protein-L-isoaspartate O-methyltransferase [Phaeobacter gallaeciensis]
MTDFAERRRMMVDTQVRPSDVTKYPIIEAMLAVPRESFVPDAQREAAYADQNIDLGDSRVLLEPRTLAKILDALDIQNDELVLDVACGLGYSTAVAARVAQMVIGVEQDEDMGRDAQDQLAEAGADNAIVHVGALAEGAAEHGPYDVIMIQGGVEDVPSALLEQLRDGGRIAAVFMTGALGEVKIGHKTGGQVSWRFAFNAGAPVLPGFEKVREFAL